jgi:methionine biosynthesis protein MetW
VRDYYEKYWSDEGVCPDTPLDRNVQALLARHAGPHDRCIDIGCGEGRTGVWLRERVASYVGVDVAQNAVEEARASGLDAHLIQDAADLPFPDDSFDLAICIEVLEHLFEPHLAVAEGLRVLGPGGRLIVTVPNVVHWRRRLDMALLGRWNPYGDELAVQKPWRDPHLRFFTAAALKRMLEEVGFRFVELGGHTGPVLREVPYLRKLARGDTPTALSRGLAMRSPALFATRLSAVARKRTG